MSRANYSDDLDNWQLIKWRGAVESAMRGKRGQAFLKEMLAAMEALPNPRLITRDLIKEGEVCALGAVGRARNLDMTDLDPEDPDTIAATFNIANAMNREIVYINDEWDYKETPEQRYQRMKRWIESYIKDTP